MKVNMFLDTINIIGESKRVPIDGNPRVFPNWKIALQFVLDNLPEGFVVITGVHVEVSDE